MNWKGNRTKLFVLLMLCVMLLAGCSSTDPITANSGGFWDKWFVYPLSQLIIGVADLFNGNFGLSIILVTVLVRLVILPLYIKSMKSTAKTQLIMPELKAIQDKYKGKTDQASQKKMQEQTMALYQKYQVNPLGGCLPMLIQMPILLAFYQAILRTEEIMSHSFMWVHLGMPDPYYILPVLSGVSTYLQTLISSQSQSQPMEGPMKIMYIMMPVMITFVGISLPSALSFYWVIGNLFGMAQVVLFNKFLKPRILQSTSK